MALRRLVEEQDTLDLRFEFSAKVSLSQTAWMTPWRMNCFASAARRSRMRTTTASARQCESSGNTSGARFGLPLKTTALGCPMRRIRVRGLGDPSWSTARAPSAARFATRTSTAVDCGSIQSVPCLNPETRADTDQTRAAAPNQANPSRLTRFGANLGECNVTQMPRAADVGTSVGTILLLISGSILKFSWLRRVLDSLPGHQ